MRRPLLVALFLLLSSCSRAAAPTSIKTDSDRIQAQVTVKVSGAETYELDTTTAILVFRTLDKRVPEGLRLFSVGIPDPGVKTTDGFFRTAFDVLGFKGDGRYTIGPTILDEKPSGPGGLRLPSGIQSNAFVQWFRPSSNPPVVRFDIALQACSVQSRDGGRFGKLVCPSLRRDNGTATVSVVVEWSAK